MFAAMRDARASLHEAVVQAGMTVLHAMLEEDRVKLCGPRYAHDAERSATRSGFADGELAFGGRRVRVRRPRVRGVEGREVALDTWERFSNADPLTPRAVEQMVLGVSTRNYDRSLESAPRDVPTRGTSRSAVSRRFVEGTRTALEALTSRELGSLALVAVMLDGIHVGGHVVLVALGIDEGGDKHILGLYEGATENATVCTALLSDLRTRGLRTERSLLFVIDGSKALVKAIRDVVGKHALIQRCQVHKKRNVEEHLPESMKRNVGRTISAAYRAAEPDRSQRMLEGLARQLDKDYPAAAASMREGLDETLTVARIGLDHWLARTLSTTNPLEFINGRIRKTSRNVKRWDGGQMILRWVAVSLAEASKTFRKLRGHKNMPKLVAALRAHDARLKPPTIDRSRKAA
jgi:transposase-like protein